MMTAKAVAEPGPRSARDSAVQLAYLSPALKMPALAASVDRLAERALAENWTHQEYLAACLARDVATPRGLWRRAPHPRCPLPGAQGAGEL